MVSRLIRIVLLSAVAFLVVGWPGTQSRTGAQAAGQARGLALDSPFGVAVDSHGAIYIADTFNHRLVKLSSRGKVLARWGRKGRKPGQFLFPTGVAVDAAGNVYVADKTNNRIQKLSAVGKPLAQWGTRGSGP